MRAVSLPRTMSPDVPVTHVPDGVQHHAVKAMHFVSFFVLSDEKPENDVVTT